MKKFRKLLSILLAVLIVASALPMSASAADGEITLTEGKYLWIYNSGYTITTNSTVPGESGLTSFSGDYVLKSDAEISAFVQIMPDYNAGIEPQDTTKSTKKITLDGLKLNTTSTKISPFALRQDGTKGAQVNLVLAENSENTLTVVKTQKSAALNVQRTAHLVINAVGTADTESTVGTLGKLTAIATANDNGGAGIGGNDQEKADDKRTDGTGAITINNGKIVATGAANAAGIGTAWQVEANSGIAGDITINGGDITATGGSKFRPAAIGGGLCATIGKITITGGKIVATDASGTGIGTGHNDSSKGIASFDEINIKGGDITATGVDGAGIGQGMIFWRTSVSSTGKINISGGTVVANSTRGAGIGAGRVNAASGTASTNIFSGDINITGGTVTATSEHGAGIGNGNNQSHSNTDTNTFSGKINISDATVTATSTNGAGIGNGLAYSSNLGTSETVFSGEINITSGTVTATSTKGAGIGNAAAGFSNGSDCKPGTALIPSFTGEVNISGGKVTATSVDGAGIGNATVGKATSKALFTGTLNISGGTVSATSTSTSTDGAGIGNASAQLGEVSWNGAINISGGSVKEEGKLGMPDAYNGAAGSAKKQVYLSALTLLGSSRNALAGKEVTAGSIGSTAMNDTADPDTGVYGMNDMYTDAATDNPSYAGGKLYIWMPAAEYASSSFTLDGVSDAVTGYFKTDSTAATAYTLPNYTVTATVKKDGSEWVNDSNNSDNDFTKTLVLKDESNNEYTGTFTGADAKYVFLGVPVGTYTLCEKTSDATTSLGMNDVVISNADVSLDVPYLSVPKITSFKLGNYAGTFGTSGTTNTISLEVPTSYDLSSVTPTIATSPVQGEAVLPSGAQNFTSSTTTPITYTASYDSENPLHLGESTSYSVSVEAKEYREIALDPTNEKKYLYIYDDAYVLSKDALTDPKTMGTPVAWSGGYKLSGGTSGTPIEAYVKVMAGYNGFAGTDGAVSKSIALNGLNLSGANLFTLDSGTEATAPKVNLLLWAGTENKFRAPVSDTIPMIVSTNAKLVIDSASGTGAVGTLNVTSDQSDGITNNGSITINGGSVYVRGEGVGILGGAVTVNGGTVSAFSGGRGISSNNIIINGGSVNAKTSSTVKNSAGTSVYLSTLTLVDSSGDALASKKVTAGSMGSTAMNNTPNAGNGVYGMNDMTTDTNGKLYVWMPAAEYASSSFTLDGVTGAVTGFFKTDSSAATTYTLPNYIATATVKKDGSAWTDSGKTFSLKPTGEMTPVYSGTTDGGTVTFKGVLAGTYDVYDGSTDLGFDATISSSRTTFDIPFISEPRIESFEIDDVAGVINHKTGKITVTVPKGTGVTKLTPTVTAKETGETIDKSGEQDFSSPIDYTVSVTGKPLYISTSKTYTVTVTVRKPPSPSDPKPTVTPNDGDDTYKVSVPESTPKNTPITFTPSKGETVDEGTVLRVTAPAEMAGEFVGKSIVNADGSITFIVPDGIEFEVVSNGKRFDDVNDEWFADNVEFTSARELFSGTTKTTFSPNDPTTRAMFATVLWRLEMKPEESGNPFDDIDLEAYYVDAALWGESSGVIEGVGDNKFAPKKNISRQELVTMMYRYAKYLGLELDESGDLSAFTDANMVSDYALPAMKWAVKAGIIEGKDDKLDPRGKATRAECAAILQRFVEYLLTVK